MQQSVKWFEERSTYISTSTPNILPYSLDSLAEEWYLSRHNIVVLVVKTNPLLLLIKNYKIPTSEICSFFLATQPHASSSFKVLCPASSPGSVFPPQNPNFWACEHRMHHEYYLLTHPAILPFATLRQWRWPWLPPSTFPPRSTCCLQPSPNKGILFHKPLCMATFLQSSKPSPELCSFQKLSLLWSAELIQLGVRALCSAYVLLCLSLLLWYWEIWLYAHCICAYSSCHDGTLKWEFDPEFIKIQSTYRLSSTALTTVCILQLHPS